MGVTGKYMSQDGPPASDTACAITYCNSFCVSLEIILAIMQGAVLWLGVKALAFHSCHTLLYSQVKKDGFPSSCTCRVFDQFIVIVFPASGAVWVWSSLGSWVRSHVYLMS